MKLVNNTFLTLFVLRNNGYFTINCIKDASYLPMFLLLHVVCTFWFYLIKNKKHNSFNIFYLSILTKDLIGNYYNYCLIYVW